MSLNINVSCSEQGKEEIRIFVSCVFQRWFGLQAAISNGMGGTPQQTHKKLSEMTDAIAHMCCNKDIIKADLSDLLEDFTDEYFNTEFQDGSVEDIASELWNRSRDWLNGNKENIRSYISANMTPNNKTISQKQTFRT